MLFLKSLQLKNFCNYIDHTFNFTHKNGSPYKYVCFYGPNGIGKSTLLDAISLLSLNTEDRPKQVIQQYLKKFIRHKNYDPLTPHDQSAPDSGMLIRGVFSLDGEDYVVELNQDGYVKNELFNKNNGCFKENLLSLQMRLSYFIRSDMDLSMNSFQLHVSQSENFEKIMSQIMRYKADCVSPMGLTKEEKEYCTDFVIHKKDHMIHFKRMSAGEKKISKAFSILLNMIHDLSSPRHGDTALKFWPRLILMDNVEMHVYYDRHIGLINSLKEVFNNHQIFATTHSGVLVERNINNETPEDELMIDLEPING